MPVFDRYVGVDYSGAQTATSPLEGLCIYVAERASTPVERRPKTPGEWTRKGIAEWLLELLATGPRTIVGIDHAFSFPTAYFERHHLPADWRGFLADFVDHWPTREDRISVHSVFRARHGNAAARSGDVTWCRLTEWRTGTAKSVFRFTTKGSVAYSTHAGLPWLKVLRDNLDGRVHFWPFDGWDPPAEQSVVAEVYPSLWRRGFVRPDCNSHQIDAYAVAEWLRRADCVGQLDELFHPQLNPEEKAQASIEGWILGVM